MPRPYSQDLRVRVIEAVEGGASRREVAELYGISPSVVVIWMQRWTATGSIEAKPSGGSTSPLDEHAEFLLGLTVEQPDMTLDEIVAAMTRAGIAGSRTAVWRFYERHDIRYKNVWRAPLQAVSARWLDSSPHQRVRSRGASPAKMEIRASRS